MTTFTKTQTGLFSSDCGNFTIEGACSGMRGMGTRDYTLIRNHDQKVIVSGSLAKCKKRAAYIASLEISDELNGWEPVSESEHQQIMQNERGLGSVL